MNYSISTYKTKNTWDSNAQENDQLCNAIRLKHIQGQEENIFALMLDTVSGREAAGIVLVLRQGLAFYTFIYERTGKTLELTTLDAKPEKESISQSHRCNLVFQDTERIVQLNFL